jgi:chaperonin GroES
VAILPDEPASKTTGGLFLPASAINKKGKLEWGVVAACGPGKTSLEGGFLIPAVVQVGDHVLFHRSYYDVEYEGQKYLILREDEIVAREDK